MTKLNEDILAAITDRDVRGFYSALNDVGVTVTWVGSKGKPDAAVEAAGYGTISLDSVGWCVRSWVDGETARLTDEDMTEEIAELVANVQAIA